MPCRRPAGCRSSLDELGVDALSLAGHKVGAPKGTGALIVRGRIPLEPVLHGGGQERGRRSGTENVAGAVAFATALRLAEAERADAATRVAALGADLDRRACRPTCRAPCSPATPCGGCPGTVSFVFPGTSGEAVLLELERDGVICSSGSACAAGSDEPSHVLTAIGVPAELAQTAVRFTLGAETTADDDRGGRGSGRPGGVGGPRYREVMTDPTPIPADDDDLEVDEQRVDDEVAPEEELLEGWLPDATPTDGPAPAP